MFFRESTIAVGRRTGEKFLRPIFDTEQAYASADIETWIEPAGEQCGTLFIKGKDLEVADTGLGFWQVSVLKSGSTHDGRIPAMLFFVDLGRDHHIFLHDDPEDGNDTYALRFVKRFW